MLRPTSYLTISLEENSAQTEMASALKRAFSYLAPTTIVAPLAASSGTETNALLLDVRLPAHPYFCRVDANADQTWQQVVHPWLTTKIETLFGTVFEFNNEIRRSFVGKIDFATFTLILEDVPICFSLEDNKLHTDLEILDNIRSWLMSNAQACANVSRIDVPSSSTETCNCYTVQLNNGESVQVSI